MSALPPEVGTSDNRAYRKQTTRRAHHLARCVSAHHDCALTPEYRSNVGLEVGRDQVYLPPTQPLTARQFVPMSTAAKPVSITVSDAIRVSGLRQTPPRTRACYVLAHGAGAGMDHPFMQAVASGLATRGIATLRYQFPYMEHGTRRPDAPPLAQATVRAAVAEA